VVEDEDISARRSPRAQQSGSALQTTDTCGQDLSAMSVGQTEKSAAIDSLNASPSKHGDKYMEASPLFVRQDTVDQIWLRFKDQAFQRLADLENLAVASAKNSLTNELYQQALSSAHKLAGSLGCFGFPEGSRLAKQIELLLISNPLEKVDLEQIFKLTVSLNSELQCKPFEETVKNALSKNISILIVDRSHDLDLARQLIIEAHNSGMKTKLATDLTHAQAILETELIDALLQKIVFPDGEDLEFLDKLHQSKPNLPFVAIAESPRLLDRLHFASTGGSLILQYPVEPMTAITAISELLANLGNTAKVLIVDDDPQVLLSLEMSLKPWGFEVTTLDQAIQFWSVLESVEPDILVLDIDMPEINGIELCQILRSDRYWQHLPVLFLSVHHDEQTQNQAFKIGADDYVCKPVTGSVLANRLLNRLRRSRS
ncbi:MAG: response regulator, partial [Cyanobacteria bacterium P01_A01_bin.83]